MYVLCEIFLWSLITFRNGILVHFWNLKWLFPHILKNIAWLKKLDRNLRKTGGFQFKRQYNKALFLLMVSFN